MLAMVRRGAETIEGADVVAVEEGFQLPLADEVILRGFIDRIDRLPEGELVRDYKTGDVKEIDNLQLDAYLLAREGSVGAVFDLLKRGAQAGFVRDDVTGEFPKKVERVSAEELGARRAAPTSTSTPATPRTARATSATASTSAASTARAGCARRSANELPAHR